MKSMQELYEEVLKNDGLKAEFIQAAKDKALPALFAKHGVTATEEEIGAFLKEKQEEQSAELTDEELAGTAGGRSGVIGYDTVLCTVFSCGA